MNAKKYIIIAVAIATATSIGAYTGGVYAQSAYASNDNQAVKC